MPDQPAYGGSEWLTIRQAADTLRIHPATLRRWEAAGRIASSRTPTGHRRYRRDDIAALLTQGSER